MENTFAVNYWGSHPDKNNDDCWTGTDFTTRETALEHFNAGRSPSEQFDLTSPAFMTIECMYIEIDGPGIYEVRKNPKFNDRERRLDDSLDRNERIMQAGMMGGCDAYNDACESA